MGESVLVPFDGSPLARRALERALTRGPDDDVTVLYVIDPILAVYETEAKGLGAARAWEERTKEWAADICGAARALAEKHGREVTTATEIGRPARAIQAYAAEHDVAHIVMGSHGREGVSRLLLGSVAEKVIRQAPMPVTIVR